MARFRPIVSTNKGRFRALIPQLLPFTLYPPLHIMINVEWESSVCLNGLVTRLIYNVYIYSFIGHSAWPQSWQAAFFHRTWMVDQDEGNHHRG